MLKFHYSSLKSASLDLNNATEDSLRALSPREESALIFTSCKLSTCVICLPLKSGVVTMQHVAYTPPSRDSGDAGL